MPEHETSPRRRWFYPLVYALLFLTSSFTPHYASTGYSYFEEGGSVIVAVMSVGLARSLHLAPFFHVATVVLVIAVVRYGNRLRRLFSLYFGVNLIFIAFAQCMGSTEEFGFSILTGSVLTLVLLGSLWIWETIRPGNDLSFRDLPLVRYWPVPLAVFAFWCPIDFATLQPDFSPALLLTSAYGIGGCVTIPVIVCLMTLLYPRVNEPLYRLTAFVGIIYGFWNMFSLLKPSTRWLGIIHIPLLVISIYALILPWLLAENRWTGITRPRRGVSG
jgi:hypothetical protein